MPSFFQNSLRIKWLFNKVKRAHFDGLNHHGNRIHIGHKDYWREMLHTIKLRQQRATARTIHAQISHQATLVVTYALNIVLIIREDLHLKTLRLKQFG